MEDYSGNAKKQRNQGPKKDKEPIEKVVTGEVVQRPKGPGRKFKEIFFGGDAKRAAKFVTADVLLPALRNLVVDMVTRGTETLVYGENARSRRPPHTNYNYGTRYSVGGPNPNPRVLDAISRATSPQPRGRQNRHDMNDIVISTRDEADLVLERLVDVLEKYDVVSLADLNELLGLEVSHIDNKWGWTYLGGAQVRQIRQGYLLELPPLEEI